MKHFLLIINILIIVSCSNTATDSHDKAPVKTDEVKEENISEPASSYSYQTMFDSTLGWGYQILNNQSLFINQPHIPSIQGNKGFDSEEKASITAEYILDKLNRNIFPPTVSISELDSLGVL